MVNVKKINGYYIKDETARNSIGELDIRTTSNENNIGELDIRTTSNENNIGDIINLINIDIIVDKAGNGDYNNISDAVSNANDGDKIYIKNGNYTNEIINCVGKKLSLIGESREGVIISNETNNYATPPLNIGKGYVENVTILSGSSTPTINDGAYGIHIDNDDETNETLIITNCYIESTCNSAVGIGLRPNCEVKFKNCHIKTKAIYNNTTNPKCSGLFVHTSNEDTGLIQKLILENTFIESVNTPALSMQSCKELNVNQAQIYVLGSTLYSEAFNYTENIIRRLLYFNSTEHNVFIMGSGFSNTPLTNHSSYKTTEGVVIDKLAYDDLKYIIKRIVIDGDINAGSRVDISLKSKDSNFGGLLAVEGEVTASDTSLQMPLFYNDGTNYFRAFLNTDSNDTTIKITSSSTGHFRLFVKYYVVMPTTSYEIES